MKNRKLLFLVFIILLNFIFITTVKADSWTDEGNYNPNWQEKCVNVCYFDDEKDFAGVLKSIKSGYHVGILEYDFTKDTLDFREHSWESLPRNFNAIIHVNEILLNGGELFSQGGQITNSPRINSSTLKIKYECDISISNPSHATAAIDKSVAFTDEIVTLLVTPEDGYHLEGVTATNAKKVTKITDNSYEITVGNNNINIIPNVIRDNHYISFNDNGGYTVKGNIHYYYGDYIDISLTPELGINIDQVLINGENYRLLSGNRIYLENVTTDLEIRVITSKYPLDSLHKEGSINLYHKLKKVDNQNNLLEGAKFKFYDHNNTLSIDFNEDKQYNGIHTFSYDNGVILYNGLTLEENDNLNNQQLDKVELYELIYNMLPDYYKELLKFTTTYDDIVNEINNNPSLFSDYNYNSNLGNRIINFNAKLPMIIEETKSPGGYIKEKYVVIENVFVVLEFYEDTNLERVNLILTGTGNSPVYKYDEIFFTSEPGTVINRPSLDLECTNVIGLSNKNDGYRIIPLHETSDICTIKVVNELGSYKLAVDSTIDDKKSVEVPYKSSRKNMIRVTNTGEASVSDAILRVDVPKNLKVIEDSISDGGLYNSTDNAIIWQIDYVDIDNPVTLSFDFTPLNNSGKDIVIPATLKKNGEELTSEVDVTVVSEIPVKNTEKDGNIISLVIVLLTLLITGLCAYKLDKKNKALKKE